MLLYQLTRGVLLLGVILNYGNMVEGHQHFCGGSISYEVEPDPVDSSKLRVQLDVLTGWVLGKGPCGPNCSNQSVGTLTSAERARIISINGVNYFGNWTREGNSGRDFSDISSDVKSGLSEKVIAVNSRDNWEQEWMRVNITINKEDTDIIFKGRYWHAFTFQNPNIPTGWHLQVKIEHAIRNDTGKPNQSPKAMIKPVYRVPLNIVSTIYLSAIDPEGDAVECSPPFKHGVEEGKINFDDQRLDNIKINPDCSVKINADGNDGFTDNMWIGYVVAMRDKNKNLLFIDGASYSPYTLTLSKVYAQFLILVSDDVQAPRFILPTEENNHEFIMFADAEWTTTVYIKPANGKTIERIEIQPRNGENIHQEGPFNLETSPGVVYMELSWAPTNADVGSHIVCIRAIDNEGMDTQTDERCFKLHVKADRFTTVIPNPNGPYFTNVPASNELVCEKEFTCVFPIMIHSDRDLERIEVTTNVDYSMGNISSSGPQEFSANFMFTQVTFGNIRICFVAFDIDGRQSESTCYNGTVVAPDPCRFAPCQNAGICKRDPYDQDNFMCTCLNDMFYLKDCSRKRLFCDSNPCSVHSRCIDLKDHAHCVCNPGYTGPQCDFKIDTCQPTDCGADVNNGICVSNGTDTSCQCYPRFSGGSCNRDMCSMVSPELKECPLANDPCHNVMCNDHGICVQPGTCACQLGYHGTHCQNADATATGGIQFVAPTIGESNTLVCYYEHNVSIPCIFRLFIASQTGITPTVTVNQGTGMLKQDSYIGPVIPDSVTKRPNTYMTDVTVQGSHVYGYNKICVMATSSGYSIKRCIEIDFKQNPMLSDKTQESRQDRCPPFVNPTPLSGSKFSCVRNEMCHIFLYVHNHHWTCPRIMPMSGVEFVVHEPIKNDTCITQVSYKFDSLGEKTACFESAQTIGEVRCYTIYIYDGNDPCENSPCLNGGLCAREYEEPHCICNDGLTGDICGNGMCLPADNNCQNGGYCLFVNDNKTCLCQKGFSGPECATVSSVGTANHGGFAPSYLPSSVTCIKDRPCSVPFLLTGNGNNQTTVKPGYTSQGTSVENITTHITSGLQLTNVQFLASKTGLQPTCVQTEDHNHIDELCFDMKVTTATPIVTLAPRTLIFADESHPQYPLTMFSQSDLPHFTDPSLPPASEVRCVADEVCHVVYTALPADQDSCLKVSVSSSTISTYYAFTSCEDCPNGYQGGNGCSIDVSFKPLSNEISSYQKPEICITLLRPGKTFATGERRCFSVRMETVAEHQKRGSCRNYFCEHGGFCDGHGPTPQCYCTDQYTGDTCTTLVSATTTEAFAKNSFNGQQAIPISLTCRLNQTCTVPFHAPAVNGATANVNIGYVSPSLTVDAINLPDPSSGVIRGNVKITPTSTGEQFICLQQHIGSLTSDEICVSVNVADNRQDQQLIPYFVDPTYATHAILACQVNKPCHIFVHYAKGSAFGSTSPCPRLVDVSRKHLDYIHIMDTQQGIHDCSNDISYIPRTVGENELCLQLDIDGRKGETRCWFVKTISDYSHNISTTCAGVTCFNGGICLNDVLKVSSHICVCPIGHSGPYCYAVSPQTALPGVEHMPSTFQPSPLPPSFVRTTFDGSSAVPVDVSCDLNAPCTIPISYMGTKPPVLGYVGTSVNLTEVKTLYPSLNDHHTVLLKVDTQTAGTHKICIQTTYDGTLTGVNIDEICFTVSVIDAGSSAGSNSSTRNIQFQEPTLPSGSTVMCQPSKTCHLTVVTAPAHGKCERIEECGSGINRVHIFEPLFVHNYCVTDVGYITSNSTTNPLCLRAGRNGQEIVYTVKTSLTHEYGPCQKKHCLHGNCLSANSTAVCVCEPGFSGFVCDQGPSGATTNRK